jgi:hypothetical protein
MQKRQGDLLIIKIDRLPEDAVPARTLVLAEGEATGHAHRLTRGQVFTTPGGGLYFESGEEMTLGHEEHGPLNFQPGVYEVRRQREYSPKGSREVLD